MICKGKEYNIVFFLWMQLKFPENKNTRMIFQFWRLGHTPSNPLVSSFVKSYNPFRIAIQPVFLLKFKINLFQINFFSVYKSF